MTSDEKLSIAIDSMEQATNALMAHEVILDGNMTIPSDEYAFDILNATLEVLQEEA